MDCADYIHNYDLEVCRHNAQQQSFEAMLAQHQIIDCTGQHQIIDCTAQHQTIDCTAQHQIIDCTALEDVSLLIRSVGFD